MGDLSAMAIGIIVILVSFLVGGGAIWLSSSLKEPLQFVVSNLGAIIIGSGVFSTVGAWISRIQLEKQMTGRFLAARELEKAGIVEVGKWPIDIPRSAVKVDILVIRAHGWFSMQGTAIVDVLSSEGAEMRICVVHSRSPVIPVLSSKFGESEEDCRGRIIDSVRGIVECAEEARKNQVRGRLIIKAHRLVPVHTYYRFDEDQYVVWYPFRRVRREPPLLKLNSVGWISEFFREDFDRFFSEDDVETVYDTAKPEAAPEALNTFGIDKEVLRRIFVDRSA